MKTAFMSPRSFHVAILIAIPLLMVVIGGLDYQKKSELNWWQRCHWRISFKAETPSPLFNQHNAAHRYSFGTIHFVGWREGSGQGARAAPSVPEARPGTAEGGAASHCSPHPDRHTGDQTHQQVRDKNMLRPSHTFTNMQFKKKRSTCPEAKCFRIVS